MSDTCPRRVPVIGLCGGIGAGKSVVASEFARRGCFVVDSDRLNREIMQRPEVIATLCGWWGQKVIGPDGNVNRKAVAEIVFQDSAERSRLESLMHPLIDRAREHMMHRAFDDRAVRAIILDSPLLFESNLNRLCAVTVFVDASEQTRRARVRQARGWDELELHRREAQQWPLQRKRAACDVVINNDNAIETVAPQVAAILQQQELRSPQSG
ncbi:MAG: dephospho-CoA kinase [Phycisphaerales bacterium]|nr:dephospho-CoA kinase [Phycisphaerales bacterium]